MYTLVKEGTKAWGKERTWIGGVKAEETDKNNEKKNVCEEGRTLNWVAEGE